MARTISVGHAGRMWDRRGEVKLTPERLDLFRCDSCGTVGMRASKCIGCGRPDPRELTEAEAEAYVTRGPAALVVALAFRAGFEHGAQHGLATMREAALALEALGLPFDTGTVDVFCNGADDGVRGDRFRLDGAQ